ncbi:hypothetical protein [Nonomuraea candida]|uniref:hypothetical protein n=1 Tax=Nonomuraea candida TaxID=359159 RepID=UPI0006944532|nr:hypothetical protein [Nonomuraea candida]
MDEQSTVEATPSVEELRARIAQLEEAEAKLKTESRKWEERSKSNYAKLMDFERAGMSDAERAKADQERIIAEAAENARRAVLGEVGSKLAAAEFKAAAAKAGIDADDLLDVIDVSKFLGEDGSPNSEVINERVSALASKWSQPKWDQNLGIGPQGSGAAGQLSREALHRMSPREIAQARKDGRLDALMRGEI